MYYIRHLGFRGPYIKYLLPQVSLHCKQWHKLRPQLSFENLINTGSSMIFNLSYRISSYSWNRSSMILLTQHCCRWRHQHFEPVLKEINLGRLYNNITDRVLSKFILKNLFLQNLFAMYVLGSPKCFDTYLRILLQQLEKMNT